jgi:hypothetical protein
VQGVSCAEVKAGTATRPRAAAEHIRTINNARDRPELGRSVAVSRTVIGRQVVRIASPNKSSRKIWLFDEQKMNDCIGIASIVRQ